MQGRTDSTATVNADCSCAILQSAHALLCTPPVPTLDAYLDTLLRAADVRTALLTRPGANGSCVARAGQPTNPPAPPDLRVASVLRATSVLGADRAVWLAAAAGTPGTPEWLLWLRGDPDRAWTEGEKGAVVLAADAAQRWLLARPEAAPAYRQRRLEHAADVSARIAHDYGNVLTSILGFADLGLQQLGRVDPRTFYLTEVRRAAEEGARFTSRLRLFGRPGQNRTVPALLELVLTDEAKRLARETGDGVTVRLALPPRFPRIALAPDLLRALVAELLDNACDALGRRGQVTLTVTLATLTPAECVTLDGNPSPGPCALLTVEDDGPGLSAEACRRVLSEPLFSTRPRRRGLGLGIAVGIARANGAGLRLDSREPNGTAVRVYLPLAAELETLADGNPRILVIDDDAMILRFVSLVLTGAGYAVETAASGVAALQHHCQSDGSPFGLALVDVCMPGLDGVETVRRLRGADPAVRVLFMSSQPLPDTARPLTNGEPSNFLQKPFRPDHLLELVRQALHTSGEVAPPSLLA